MNSFSAYLELCKPRVVSLILITAAVGMLLTMPHWIVLGAKNYPQLSNTPPQPTLHWGKALIALLGIGLAAACGAAINHMVEQKIDARMARTHRRPLPTGKVQTKQAFLFATFIGSLGISLLWYFVNPLTAILTLGALIGYGVIYTLFLKRNTPQNIVIGGLAGAMPPLLGWIALTNHIDPAPLLLVLIVFTWTPPHFWALAIDRHQDYKKTGLPMLPVTHGIPFTKKCILLYTLLMIVATLLPVIIQASGLIYLIASIALNLRFMQWAIRLYRSPDHTHALPTFRYSITYLGLLFLALLIDHVIFISI